MKKNNQGFMITEALIVSTIVLGVLVFMYAQFKSITNGFNQTFKYNTVENIYKSNEIKKFIETDATDNMISLLENSKKNYIDITECKIETYNNKVFCSTLYEKLGVKTLLLLTEDISGIDPMEIENLDNGTRKFLDYIKNNYTGNYHRIVVSYDDGTYATLRIDVLNNTYDFEYTGDVQTFTAAVDGYYQVELWGAQGGTVENFQGGKGAYTKGVIYLKKSTKLYIYVGGEGKTDLITRLSPGGYNGGGLSGHHENAKSTGGGGATDIRLINGESLDFNSLKSRIMVAAGGGGTTKTGTYEVIPGDGGTLIGSNGTGSHNPQIAYGGSQISGGEGHNLVDYRKGQFGYAPYEHTFLIDEKAWGGGGGSGYYGGALGFGHGGGGGSSFISGYDGCDAITENSTADNIVHTGQSIHYSGYKFEYGEMIAGNSEMPNPSGGIMTGNSGNGFARITVISG